MAADSALSTKNGLPVAPDAGRAIWHGKARGVRDRERRQRLLEAALELYGTAGYRATTVQAVCKLAKVSTRSFYELYADHEQLLAELYEDLNEEVLAAIVLAGDSPGPDVFTAVEGLVAAALGPMLVDDRKARVMEVEVVGISDALERQRRLTIRRIAGAVDTGFDALVERGLIASAPKGLSSLILIGGITEVLVQRVQTEPALREPTPDFVADIARVIVRMAVEQ